MFCMAVFSCLIALILCSAISAQMPNKVLFFVKYAWAHFYWLCVGTFSILLCETSSPIRDILQTWTYSFWEVCNILHGIPTGFLLLTILQWRSTSCFYPKVSECESFMNKRGVKLNKRRVKLLSMEVEWPT